MRNTTIVAIALCALAACQTGGAAAVCRKAERAGVLARCRQFQGVTEGATDAVEADDVQVSGMSRVIIASYRSDEWYAMALRKFGDKNPVCLHGNANKRIIVIAHAPAFDSVCQAVYDIVDAEK